MGRLWKPVPRLYRVGALEGALNGGGSLTVAWRFPKAGRVTRLFMLPTSATAADFAGLELGIVSHKDEQLVTDGRRAQTAPLRALFGAGLDWLPLAIDVPDHARWAITVVNNTNHGVSPILLFGFEDARPGEHASPWNV